MKNYLRLSYFALILLLSNGAVAGKQLDIVAENIPGVYDIHFDNGDMLVTSNDALIRVELSKGRDDMGMFPRVIIADAPDIALSTIKEGSDYYLLRNIDRALVKVSHSGNTTLITDRLGAPIDIARHGDTFIISDIGNPLDSSENTRLLSVTKEGVITEIVGTGFEEFAGMAGIEVVGDTFWVTDFNLGLLYKIDLEGDVSIVAHGLGHPVGIEYDGKDFIVADFGDGMEGIANGRILRVSKKGDVRNIMPRKSRKGLLGNPSDISLFGADIYFSDIIASRVTRIDCGLCKKRRFKVLDQ